MKELAGALLVSWCAFGWAQSAEELLAAGKNPDNVTNFGMIPPSPRLLARRTSTTYFSDTTSVMAQKIIDSTPITSACPIPAPCSPATLSLKAYNGLVPISP